MQVSAIQVDEIRIGNWQRAGGTRVGPLPEPLLGMKEEPADKPPAKPKMTAAEVRDELARRREARSTRAS